MAKQSPAKTKKLASEAKKAGAQRRAQKVASRLPETRGEVLADRYSEVDDQWREIGLDGQARHALIDDGLYKLTDLRKVSLEAIKDLEGIGPNTIRVLVAEMKKVDLSFRK